MPDSATSTSASLKSTPSGSAFNFDSRKPGQAQGNFSDEFISSVIADLQKDRMELKMKDARQRFHKLQAEDGAFNGYMRNIKCHRDSKLKMAPGEQKTLEYAIGTVVENKRKMKKELCSVRVVELGGGTMPTQERAS